MITIWVHGAFGFSRCANGVLQDDDIIIANTSLLRIMLVMVVHFWESGTGSGGRHGGNPSLSSLIQVNYSLVDVQVLNV
jgi:hypothetical protein